MGDVSERLTAEVGGFVSGMEEAAAAARKAASAVRKLRKDADELAAGGGGLAAMDAGLDGVRDRATEAAAALAAMKREARGAASAGGGTSGISRMARDLGKVNTEIERFGKSGGSGGILGGASRDIARVADESERAASFAGTMGDAWGKVSGLGMPAMFTGIAAAASTVGPVLLSVGAGFGAFGALAAPTLMKVKNAYQQVSAAQKTYDKAQALYQQRPTKANAAAVTQDLAKLKAAYASVPADLRPAVKAIHGVEDAWSRTARKSGIQKDILGDIPKVAKDIRGLMPVVAGLGKATAPVFSNLLGDIGKFEKSKGFTDFISRIKGEIPKAMPALHSMGNAVSTLVSSLTSKSNMAIGNNLIKSVSGMMKSITPQAVHELGQAAKTMSQIANWIPKFQHSAEGKAAGGIWNTGMSWLGDTLKFVSGDPNAFRSMGLAKAQQLARQNAAAARTFGKSMQTAIQSWNKSMKLPGLGGGKQGSLFPKTITTHVKVTSTGAEKAKSDLKQIQHAGSKTTKAQVQVHVSGADQAKSQLDAVKAKAAGHFTQPKIQVQITGAQAATSQLNRLGTSAGTMASAVAASAGRAMSSVSQMSSGMRGAIAPLPGDFRAVGMSAAQGMASGIAAGTGAAVAAARSMAQQVERAAKVHLESHSPSRKFQKIGADTIAGFILGLQGGKDQVQAAMRLIFGSPFSDPAITSAIKKLKLDVQDAFNRKLAGSHSRADLEKELGKAKKGTAEYKRLEKELHGPTEFKQISKSQELALTKLLDRDNKKLMALAKQRQSIENQIKAAEALAASVKQDAISGADITGIAGNTQQGLIQASQAQGAPGTEQNPYTSIEGGLQDRLSQIKRFQSDIKKLKREGLDRTSIKQLLQAGVTGGGLSTAEQLLGEGKGGVKKVAELQKEIGKAAGQLGVTGANAAYESGRDLGRGLAAGLKDSLKDVNKAMGNIAKSLVTSLMTALGASSKDIRKALQKLDKELGLGDGSGGGGGSKVKPPHIVEHHKGERMRPGPVHRHQPIMHPDSMTMLPPGGYAGHGGGTDVIVINLTSELKLDGKTHARTVQTHTLRRARRNTRSGMTLPLRGT
jgi:hypothetical protein